MGSVGTRLWVTVHQWGWAGADTPHMWRTVVRPVSPMSTMSTVSVSSYSFHKPKYFPDTSRWTDSLFSRGSGDHADDNIFGREKQSYKEYVYDIPRSLVSPQKRPPEPGSGKHGKVLRQSVCFDKPTNYKKNGVHLCQDEEKIRRWLKLHNCINESDMPVVWFNFSSKCCKPPIFWVALMSTLAVIQGIDWCELQFKMGETVWDLQLNWSLNMQIVPAPALTARPVSSVTAHTAHCATQATASLSSHLTLPIFSHQSEKSNLILILLPANCWWAGYQVSTGGDHAPMVQCSTPGRLSAPWSGSAVTGQPIIHCTATPPSPGPRDQAAIFNLVPQPSSCALTCCSTPIQPIGPHTPHHLSYVYCPTNLVDCGKIAHKCTNQWNKANRPTLLLHDI